VPDTPRNRTEYFRSPALRGIPRGGLHSSWNLIRLGRTPAAPVTQLNLDLHVRHDLVHLGDHDAPDFGGHGLSICLFGDFQQDLVVDEIDDPTTLLSQRRASPNLPEGQLGAIAGQALKDGVMPGTIACLRTQPARQGKDRLATPVRTGCPIKASRRP